MYQPRIKLGPGFRSKEILQLSSSKNARNISPMSHDLHNSDQKLLVFAKKNLCRRPSRRHRLCRRRAVTALP
jgi:hypothetical protein